jgi:hypothetical protein
MVNSAQTEGAQLELERQHYWFREKIRIFTGEIDVGRFQNCYTVIGILGGGMVVGFKIFTDCYNNCRASITEGDQY